MAPLELRGHQRGVDGHLARRNVFGALSQVQVLGAEPRDGAVPGPADRRARSQVEQLAGAEVDLGQHQDGDPVVEGVGQVGAVDDPLSPLDPELRVKGTEGLRVADASVFPEHTTVNPNITVMLVGERCAELVSGSR